MSTRTRETKGSWLKYKGVTADQMADIIAAMPDVLGATPMTRGELADGVIAATGHEDLRPSPDEFSRWFDLSPRLAKASFARLGERLRPVAGFGFLPADVRDNPADLLDSATGDTVHLLPAFDPYVVGSLRQLDAVCGGPPSAVSRPQGWISPTLVVNGRIEGTWEPGPIITAFRKLDPAVREALPEGATII